MLTAIAGLMDILENGCRGNIGQVSTCSWGGTEMSEYYYLGRQGTSRHQRKASGLGWSGFPSEAHRPLLRGMYVQPRKAPKPPKPQSPKAPRRPEQAPANPPWSSMTISGRRCALWLSNGLNGWQLWGMWRLMLPMPSLAPRVLSCNQTILHDANLPCRWCWALLGAPGRCLPPTV